jgi:hypothetical protein
VAAGGWFMLGGRITKPAQAAHLSIVVLPLTNLSGEGLKALHTLSAYATNARLTFAQLSVPEKTNEITAMPDLLDQLAQAKQLKGALVTVDAMGCQVAIADKIVAHGADYLLGLERQPISWAERQPADPFAKQMYIVEHVRGRRLPADQ